MSHLGTLPDKVQIAYKRTYRSHVFTSPDLKGLHVGGPDLLKAYQGIAPSVSALVEAMLGVNAEYEVDMTYEKFQQAIANLESGGIVDAERLFDPILNAERRSSDH
jgi:hypothetical protein